jgi:hypothetical protein
MEKGIFGLFLLASLLIGPFNRDHAYYQVRQERQDVIVH